jgi:hypothetical protein
MSVLYDHLARPVKRISGEEGPKGVENVESFGFYLNEADIKKGLQEINPDIHFDMGGNLNLYHPSIERWQGVFHNGRHICSMDRGVIPEYDCWGMNKHGQKVKIMRIGWRSTFHLLVKKRVPNVTWDALCLKFKVDYKHFKGNAFEMAARV